MKREEFLSSSLNHTGIYIKSSFKITYQYCQIIAKIINQIRNYGTDEENNYLPWDELVQIVQTWEGNVGILGCHELNEFEFRIYPVLYYNPKPGNRSYKNTTDSKTTDAAATDATTKPPLIQLVSCHLSEIRRFNLIFLESRQKESSLLAAQL